MHTRCGVALFGIFFTLALAGQAMASGITNSSDDLRTGWYPDEPSINSETLANGTFGKTWEASVEGQVYAQPLLDGSTLLVATEQNQIYGLYPASGTQKWHTGLGTPWNPKDIECGDLTPSIGVTATPVIDPATNTAYMTHKTYVSGTSGPARWYMDAIELATGHEKAGFPVQLSGKAQNAPGQEFEPTHELQRPGLLLLEGVVYAGFGSDCDIDPFQGWVFGVSESGTVTARWTSQAGGSGSGIWQSGAGLVSDGPGTILLVTGNGATPTPGTPGNEPPEVLGESVVRLRVQGNGQLQATDFFAPANAEELGLNDIDFASSGITGLPDSFGTPSLPHLAVAAGKEGFVYLLNRDKLGGIAKSEAGELASVVQKTQNFGGVWSRPAVWPGEGGWVYIPTASKGMEAGGSSGFLRVYRYGLESGTPHLFLAGTSKEEFGFSSGAPVITSNGTTPGSALVWVEWTKDGSGEGAELRAYAPVPVSGAPQLLWHEQIGTSAKFATPGVSGGRMFVGTRDGHVLGFGPALTGTPTEFPATLVGHSTEREVTLTAGKTLEILKLSAAPGQFATSQLTSPVTLGKGGTVHVPVTFTPTSSGLQAGMLIATVHVPGHSQAQIQVPLSGTGEEPAKPPPAPQTPTPLSPGVTPFPGSGNGPGPIATLTSRTLIATRDGKLSLRVSCPAGESVCAGTVSIQTLRAVRIGGSKRAKILTLAYGYFQVAGGHSTIVHLRLSPYGRRLLARNRQVRLRVVVAAHDSAGLRNTARSIVTVRTAHSH
jgi:iron transport multicopper oxidase